MAWPSGTKASTANVDAGTDSPASARSDIKQNIDNVNAIIDEFNISSPNNGDLLQYNSTTEQWEQVASSSIGGGGGDFAVMRTLNTKTSVGSGLYAHNLAENLDPNGIVSITNSYEMNLAAGSYIMEFVGIVTDDQTTITAWDGSSSLDTLDFNEIGTTGESICLNIISFTLSESAVVYLRDNQTIGRGAMEFKITKF